MAACSDSPLPRILLARHESRSHASREPACQPAGPGAAPLSPGTLWRWLRGGILRTSEHFKQKGERHPRGSRGRSRGKRQNSVAKVIQRQGCAGAGATTTEREAHPHPHPGQDGYRQKTRTFLSVRLQKMCCSSGDPNQ